jgi:starvation-inducible DNA-binding protein
MPEKTIARRNAQSITESAAPAGITHQGVEEIAATLRSLLADVFTLYLKTKNFHWHIAGPHFRDRHLMLDEQADQLLAMTDDIAERARKLGAETLHSIGDIASHQRLQDNDAASVSSDDMLTELAADNTRLTLFLRAAHEVCDRRNDFATTSLIENWIDESERRSWFLSETVAADVTR